MKFTNIFWATYKNLEKEIVELSYSIHFTDIATGQNGRSIISLQYAYSNRIADLLISCAIQIETIIKELANNNDIGKSIKFVKDYYGVHKRKVKIISQYMYFTEELGDYFAPMGYEKEGENDYYSAYCAVKHNRHNVLYKANVNVLIRSLAALFILNLYHKNSSYSVGDISEFDMCQGSDVFIASCGNAEDTPSDSYVFVFIENKEYFNNLEIWANSAPSDLADLSEYREKNPPMAHYEIMLNKEGYKSPVQGM